MVRPNGLSDEYISLCERYKGKPCVFAILSDRGKTLFFGKRSDAGTGFMDSIRKKGGYEISIAPLRTSADAHLYWTYLRLRYRTEGNRQFKRHWDLTIEFPPIAWTKRVTIFKYK